jgi:hypothetical protein
MYDIRISVAFAEDDAAFLDHGHGSTGYMISLHLG